MRTTIQGAHDGVMLTEDALLQMARDRRASYERQAETFRLVREVRRNRIAAVLDLTQQRRRQKRVRDRHPQAFACPV
jgi:hypothetical protein